MQPNGRVTLVCNRKGRLQTIDILVVDVLGNKPPLLTGNDVQALEYLKIYADETKTVGDKILQTLQTLPPLRMLMAEDILRQNAIVFRPGYRKPLTTLMHIELDNSVNTCTCSNTPSAHGKVRPGK